MNHIDQLMQDGLADGVYPGAVLLVSRQGSILFHAAYGKADIFTRRKMTRHTVFDLASLTKPLATTLGIMKLIEQKKLSLDKKIGEFLPWCANSDKSFISIRQLLCHCSGLPAYRPFYKILRKIEPAKRQRAFEKLIQQEPLTSSIGKMTVYSDFGFMLLGQVIESISQIPLDQFVDQHIYKPLGLGNMFFPGRSVKVPGDGFAATEFCMWRKTLLNGVVHDDNAYVMGGVAGHAGLFATAKDLHCLLWEMLDIYHGAFGRGVFHKDLLEIFWRPCHDSDKTLGFDTPAAKNSSAGNLFSRHSIGHLGFTGTSFWIDLDQDLVVVFLTNRVHPLRHNNKLKFFRPKLHNLVWDRVLSRNLP